MYIFEIFFKRRKYSAVFDKVWQQVSAEISLSPHTEAAVEPQLELFYYVSVYYAAVYQAAIAAEMSTSSAHYLARIQTQKSGIDKSIVAQAQELFSAPEDAQFKACAESIHLSMQAIVAAVMASESADSAAQLQTMGALAESFLGCEFSASDLSRLNN